MEPLFREWFFSVVGLVALLIVVLAFLLAFLVIYVLGSIRRSSDVHSAPMLGAKVFLALLISVALQIMFFGSYRLVAIAIGAEERPAEDISPYRLPLGIFLGGLLASAYPSLLYSRIRRREVGVDAVWRSAIGVNAVFTGLVFVVAATVLVMLFMIKAEDLSDLGALAMTYLVVSLVAHCRLQALWALRIVREKMPDRRSPRSRQLTKRGVRTNKTRKS